MTSLTVKLPGSLDKKLRTAAKKRGEKISTLARRALEKEAVPTGSGRVLLVLD